MSLNKCLNKILFRSSSVHSSLWGPVMYFFICVCVWSRDDKLKYTIRNMWRWKKKEKNSEIRNFESLFILQESKYFRFFSSFSSEKCVCLWCLCKMLKLKSCLSMKKKMLKPNHWSTTDLLLLYNVLNNQPKFDYIECISSMCGCVSI